MAQDPRAYQRSSSSITENVLAAGLTVGNGLAYVAPHLSGAIDIMVVRQPDGSCRCSPFYVRFGKYTGMRSRDKTVKIRVNGEEVGFSMHLGRTGEAYFVREVIEDQDGDEEDSLAGLMSPPSGYSSGDDPPPYATAAHVAAIQSAVEDLRRSGGGAGGTAGVGGAVGGGLAPLPGCPSWEGGGAVASELQDQQQLVTVQLKVAGAEQDARRGDGEEATEGVDPGPPYAHVRRHDLLTVRVRISPVPAVASQIPGVSPRLPGRDDALDGVWGGSPGRVSRQESYVTAMGDTLTPLPPYDGAPLQGFGRQESVDLPGTGSQTMADLGDSIVAAVNGTSTAAAADGIGESGISSADSTFATASLGVSTEAATSTGLELAGSGAAEAFGGSSGGVATADGQQGDGAALQRSTTEELGATEVLGDSIAAAVAEALSPEEHGANDNAANGGDDNAAASSPLKGLPLPRRSPATTPAKPSPVKPATVSQLTAQLSAAAASDAAASTLQHQQQRLGSLAEEEEVPTIAAAAEEAEEVAAPAKQQQQQLVRDSATSAVDDTMTSAADAGILGSSPTDGYLGDSELPRCPVVSSPPLAIPGGVSSGEHQQSSSAAAALAAGGLELSVCRSKLRPEMGPHEAYAVFSSGLVTEPQYRLSGGALLADPDLMCRVGDRLHAWRDVQAWLVGTIVFGGALGAAPWELDSATGVPLALAPGRQAPGSAQGGVGIGPGGDLQPLPPKARLPAERSSSWRWLFSWRSSSSSVRAAAVGGADGAGGKSGEAGGPGALMVQASRDSVLSVQGMDAESLAEAYDAVDLEAMQLRRDSSWGEGSPPPRRRQALVRRRAFTPTPEQLASLPLAAGQNTVEFTFGKQTLRAYVYYMHWRTRLVISDVDGTITKSDVLGHLLPALGLDWSHSGIPKLFTDIHGNGYAFMYLSSRAIAQASITRNYLHSLTQDGAMLPLGPVLISPQGLLPSLYREIVLRRPHEFKIRALEDVRALFPQDVSPFYAGFGNRDTDEISYMAVGVPASKIFIINPRGELRLTTCRVTTSTWKSLHSINELVDGMFPPVKMWAAAPSALRVRLSTLAGNGTAAVAAPVSVAGGAASPLEEEAALDAAAGQHGRGEQAGEERSASVVGQQQPGPEPAEQHGQAGRQQQQQQGGGEPGQQQQQEEEGRLEAKASVGAGSGTASVVVACAEEDNTDDIDQQEEYNDFNFWRSSRATYMSAFDDADGSSIVAVGASPRRV